MSSKTRLIVLSISAPVIAFAIIGGLLGSVLAREETYQHLKVFDEVVSFITGKYVEPVNVDKVMRGGMRGLADGLDADSAYLSMLQATRHRTRWWPVELKLPMNFRSMVAEMMWIMQVDWIRIGTRDV